jgi:hypothetical protein
VGAVGVCLQIIYSGEGQKPGIGELLEDTKKRAELGVRLLNDCGISAAPVRHAAGGLGRWPLVRRAIDLDAAWEMVLITVKGRGYRVQ